MYVDFFSYFVPVVLLVIILASAIKIVPEYERGVVFFLGRFQGVKGPGLIIIIPGIQQITRVDLRVITLDIPSQDVISQDNVTRPRSGASRSPTSRSSTSTSTNR